MPSYIIKLTEDKQSWYLEYSSIVDAPITYGMSLKEFKEYYEGEYGRSSMKDLKERLRRVEKKGTSSMIHDSAEGLLSYNRAGKNETCLTIQQIIDYYCRAPDFQNDAEQMAYEKTKPKGKKIEDD